MKKAKCPHCQKKTDFLFITQSDIIIRRYFINKCESWGNDLNMGRRPEDPMQYSCPYCYEKIADFEYQADIFLNCGKKSTKMYSWTNNYGESMDVLLLTENKINQ